MMAPEVSWLFLNETTSSLYARWYTSVIMNIPQKSHSNEASIARPNPFAEVNPQDNVPTDEELVSSALAGNRDTLEILVRRHQPWVFNIAIRMVWRRALAEDATQEILIKVVTKLSTFRGQSKFRTWLYRIAFNQLLNVRKSEFEDPVVTFTDMGRSLDETPDLDLPDPRSVPVELPLLVEEARVGCMTAMLMCLDRRQRMAFILGEYLGATSEVGGEVMEVSPAKGESAGPSWVSGSLGIVVGAPQPRRQPRHPDCTQRRFKKGRAIFAKEDNCLRAASSPLHSL